MAVTGTPVSAENSPVTTDEAKDWMRVDVPDDDTMIAGLLLAATNYVETFTGRTLLTATKYHYLTVWEYPIELPDFPLQSASITYVDTDGVTQTLSASLYDVDTTQEPGFIRVGYGDTWPTLRGDANGIIITYVAGYGDASDVPEGLKVAIKMTMASWYENREATISGTIIAKVPMAVDDLLWQYRILEAG